MAQDPARLRRGLAQQLDSLAQAGVTHLPKAKRRAAAASVATAPAASAPAKAARPAPAANAASTPGQAAAGRTRAATSAPPATRPQPTAAGAALPALTPAQRLVALECIKHEVQACTRCKHLASARTQTVFGVGNTTPRLCFLGEAPGADEDRLGEPFVGRAGQLLTKIIEACTFKREDVYILNVLKCRPPDNRTPEPPEIANCRGFLDRQLEVLQPQFICCLGATAAQTLLGSVESIGRLRKRFHQHGNAKVICTYHPSYLLRNPPAKKDVWDDMQMLLKEMGVKLPTKE